MVENDSRQKLSFDRPFSKSMKFPERPREWEEVKEEIYRLRERDIAFSRILGTMCAKPEENLKRIYMDFLETNLGDPGKFPGTKEIEDKLTDMVLDLFNAPESAGCRVVSGGTEGNMLAVAIARNMKGGEEILIPEHAHFSFQKIAKIAGIKIKVIESSKNHVINPAALQKNITDKTFGVVAVAGTTELGLIDPIPDISDICFDNNLFLHVDAAFGGFIIPFLKDLGYDLPDFDFKLRGVSAITADGHKMGGCAVPLGFLMVRDERWFRYMEVETPYVSTRYQSTLLGTRSGGPVAYGYARFNLLGRKGFKEIAKKCMELTRYTKRKLEEKGFKVLGEPVLNVLAVMVDDVDRVIKNLYERGWGVNPLKRLSSFRIVIHPHMNKEIIDKFVEDLEDVCKEVKT